MRQTRRDRVRLNEIFNNTTYFKSTETIQIQLMCAYRILYIYSVEADALGVEPIILLSANYHDCALEHDDDGDGGGGNAGGTFYVHASSRPAPTSSRAAALCSPLDQSAQHIWNVILYIQNYLYVYMLMCFVIQVDGPPPKLRRTPPSLSLPPRVCHVEVHICLYTYIFYSIHI